VSAIVVENGRLALRSDGQDFPSRETLRPIVGEGVTVSRRDIWLPMEHDWRRDLANLLETLDRLAIDGPAASDYTSAGSVE